MKKGLLSVLLVFVLIIGILPSSIIVNAAGPDLSQTEDYGAFINGDQVINEIIAKYGTDAHPRIIMTNEKFTELKKHINDGSKTASLLEDLRKEANGYLTDPVSEYDASDEDSFLEISKRVQRRVATLALAYNIFDAECYAERAYKELKAACEFPNWNPYHFLDTAEMCTAFAFGYDWLYHWMTDAQKNHIRKNLIEKGLKQVMNDYEDNLISGSRSYYWYRATMGDNWQFVCTGGTNLAALAIGDESDSREISAKVLDYGYKRAYISVRRGYSAEDGTYIEGLGYWDYATYYLGFQSSALISATGTDYGLADYEGLRKSVDFVRYMSSNIPTSFSFGDDGAERNTGWPVFLWLGDYYNSPALSVIRLNNRKKDKDGFRYQDVLWIDESKQTDSDDIYNETDWGAVGSCNASFRNNWDISGIVAALHVGENNYTYHGHYDLGSFYVEANGTRFFTDLGNEKNYSLYNRKFSYRIKAEGHNTLVINPTQDIDQREGANCLITEFNSGNEAYAITDLTEAYEPSGANRVIRGLKMIKDKECVVIQDEISLNTPGDIYWFAHTQGRIDIAADGRSAIVTVGSDRLWVGLLSEDGIFTEMEAKPLSTSLNVSGATNNSDYRKLAIHLTDTKDATISVACIPLRYGETSPLWTPTVKVLSKWSSDDENHNFVDYGNGEHKCSVCGATEKHDFLAQVNEAIVGQLVSVADCTHPAVYKKYCKDCLVLSDETFEAGTALGHTYDLSEKKWAEDGSSCKFVFVCQRDENHVEKVNATITGAVKTEATCVAKGTTTYTATCVFEGTEYADTKDVEDIAIDSTKHSFTNYVYNNDASLEKAGTKTAVCDQGCGATDTVDDSEHPKLTPSPTPTEEPSVTPSPTQIEKPGATPTSVPLNTPVVTQTPVVPEIPVVIQTPAVTDVPVVTQKPVVTDVPVFTQKPVVTDVPVVTKKPVVTETPITNVPTVTPGVISADTVIKKNGTVVETKVEIAEDGSVIESKKTTAVSGKITEVTRETAPDGTVTDSKIVTRVDGSSTEKVVKTSADGKQTSSMTFEFDKDGNVVDTNVEFSVISGNKKLQCSVADLTNAVKKAGGDVVVSFVSKNTSGSFRYEVKASSTLLKKNGHLSVIGIDENGRFIILDSKKNTAEIQSGQLKLNIAFKGNIQLVSEKEARNIIKSVLANCKPANAKVSLKSGKRSVYFKLDEAFNKKSISDISYIYDKENVTVSKNGKITLKKAGKYVVKAVITMKNGSKKTVKMTVSAK